MTRLSASLALLLLLSLARTVPAPIYGVFSTLDDLIDSSQLIVVARILKAPEDLDFGSGGIFELRIEKVLKGDLKEGGATTAYLRDLPVDLRARKEVTLTHDFTKHELYLLFLNRNEGQVTQDGKPLPVEFINANTSGDAVWVTQRSVHGHFDLDRLNGKTPREAVVALLTNTANQYRGMTAAIEAMIASRTAQRLTQRVISTIWIQGDVAEAMKFYRSIFEDSDEDLNIKRYTAVLPSTREPLEGSKLIIEGQEFVVLVVRPEAKLSAGTSLTLSCDTQEEIDHYWTKLSAGGETFRAGWIKDRFGVHWQIVPSDLEMMLGGQEPSVHREHVLQTLRKMEKIDAAALYKAGH